MGLLIDATIVLLNYKSRSGRVQTSVGQKDEKAVGIGRPTGGGDVTDWLIVAFMSG